MPFRPQDAIRPFHHVARLPVGQGLDEAPDVRVFGSDAQQNGDLARIIRPACGRCSLSGPFLGQYHAGPQRCLGLRRQPFSSLIHPDGFFANPRFRLWSYSYHFPSCHQFEQLSLVRGLWLVELISVSRFRIRPNSSNFSCEARLRNRPNPRVLISVKGLGTAKTGHNPGGRARITGMAYLKGAASEVAPSEIVILHPRHRIDEIDPLGLNFVEGLRRLGGRLGTQVFEYLC